MGHSSGSSSEVEGGNINRSNKRKAKKERKKFKKKTREKRTKREEEHSQVDAIDKEDADRLLISLLQLSPQMEKELLDVFEQLDSWGIVYLHDLGDLRLRKKLRHLFRALCVGEVEGEKGKGWRKALTYKSSLSKLVKRRCKELRSQLDLSSFPSEVQQPEVHESEENPAKELAFDAERAERKAEEAVQRWRGQQPQDSSLLPTESPQQELAHQSAVNGGAPRREEWMLEAPAYLRCLATEDKPAAKRMKILQQKKKEDEEAVRVKAVMDEWNKSRKLQSLREMREQGDFAEGEEAYKRWKRSMDAARNVWGKRAAEQAVEQEFQDDVKKGQPWQRFDRDRDLQVTRQIPRDDYKKLLEETKLNARFKSSWQTSFL
ncbi:hypothetical protein, conserved [Eimeria tenella]|uniref:Uncharacterized protein n=1 Tax=Eimeria tenella TaxID=5802 RepID=U6KUE4_EIMTE|nr:hypothetical protein, conserved [Eimeria tenella]CDJ40533.1 hypothetical protein, conserved [Eimeria tenella]|eukprot:XP_013231283.1 hypothetical protein, conserved [Eimeria tenella]